MKSRLTIVFVLVGVLVFEFFIADAWFPNTPGGGINFKRALAAGVVAGVFGFVGSFVTVLLEKKE